MRRSLGFILITVSWLSSNLGQEPPATDDASANPTRTVADESPSITELIQKIRPSVVTIRVNGRDGNELAMGTGFVIDASGLIATNLHVISEGRPFTVELPDGRQLPVISVESTDRAGDLAIVRVDVGSEPPRALPLLEQATSQGTRVLAFGNPLGFRDSVVSGIVSAVREIDDRELIQLAMPVQPGNSGGPLVDLDGNVRGIINMKSAIDDNLGFAIPISQLMPIRDRTNPVSYERWVTLGTMDPETWQTLFGATWQQRGGIITARGLGSAFGGRSLCLARSEDVELPIEIAVDVRYDDDSGAAGLAFHADGQDRHYGFYPSNGRMRLTCFKGPSVYTWEVLEDVATPYYLPERWNRIRVRIETDRLQCFVNEHLVIESNDQQLTGGQVGLVKFRNTQPRFKRFQIGNDLAAEQLSEDTSELLRQVLSESMPMETADSEVKRKLGQASDAVSLELEKQAVALEEKAKQMRRLAVDVTLAPILQQLEQILGEATESEEKLLRGALMIAKLDNHDIDIDAYVNRVDRMAEEIKQDLAEDADPITRRNALNQYLFEENGFHGGRAEYYHPANSHLDRVIDDREGLPITLSILYMELGRRVGIDVQGIGLPGHFVTRHVIDENNQQLIDVFDRGLLLSDQDAVKMVRQYAGRAIREEDLRSQTVVEILARVVNNLLGIASRQADLEAVRRYCEALVAIEPDSAESRIMRSQARAMTQRKAEAVEDLDWLIERIPPGINRNQAIDLRNSLIERE